MTTASPVKTMTPAQMAWALAKGFAWPDPMNADEDCNWETYWTREGGYQWDVNLQAFAMVI